MTVVANATDAIGRHGVAVAMTYQGVRSEWVFSKQTLQYLGERDINTANGSTTVARLRPAARLRQPRRADPGLIHLSQLPRPVAAFVQPGETRAEGLEHLLFCRCPVVAAR